MYETVRKFLTYDPKPEWCGTTLFLDGLDESRAGTEDGRKPLDKIAGKLGHLERPRFRLSCRWADWLAATDKEALRDVSRDGNLIVIRLDPLSKANIKAILARNHGVEDPDSFIAAARERGVERLLRNPQNLKLLAQVVSDGRWPESRRETFESELPKGGLRPSIGRSRSFSRRGMSQGFSTTRVCRWGVSSH